MNECPLFSVIIPMYNVEKYICDCIRSVQQQSCQSFEVILVDDGSPDSCPEICDRFAREDSRIRVIHRENGGTSAARRAGCDLAKGNYLLFLDGDDLLSPDCLSAVEEQIVTNSVDMICFGMYYGDGKKYVPIPIDARYGHYTRNEIEQEIFPRLIQKNDATYFPPSLCGKAVRRELLQDMFLVDRRCTIGEDGACIIPCIYRAESMIILKDCLYYYKYNGASATKGKNVIPWECPAIIYRHISKFVDPETADFAEQMDRKLVHDIFSVAVSQFYRDEPYRDIVRDIKKQIGRGLYAEAIDRSRFSGSVRARLMRFALMHHQLFLVYAYSKVWQSRGRCMPRRRDRKHR